MDALERLLNTWGRDPAAERELIQLIHNTVAPAFRAAARTWHAPDQADDAEQEFWIWLLERDLQPLRRAIQGHTAKEVNGFLWVVATRRAHRWFRRRSEQRDREQQALGARPPEPPGPTEAEILAITAEFEARLTPRQRQVLHELLGDQPAETTVEPETSESCSSPGKSLIYKEIQRLYWKVREMLRG